MFEVFDLRCDLVLDESANRIANHQLGLTPLVHVGLLGHFGWGFYSLGEASEAQDQVVAAPAAVFPAMRPKKLPPPIDIPLA